MPTLPAIFSSANSRARSAMVSLVAALAFSACSEAPENTLLAPKALRLAEVVEPARQHQLVILAPASIAGVVPSATATFGPVNYAASGPVVEVSGLACAPIPTNTVPGAIALIERGTCPFVTKVLNAQNAGYAGVLIYNNVPGAAPGLGGSSSDIVIGAQGISREAGQMILEQLRAGNQVVVNMLSYMGVEGELPPRLAVLSPPSMAGPVQSTVATFGPQFYGREGQLVNVGGLACTALPTNTIPGAIALVERGTCPFVLKALNAQNAGYAGILIYNNVDGPMTVLGGSDPSVTIPAQGITRATGLALIAALGAGNQVIVAMFGYPDETPPVVQVPEDITADATSAAGATVAFVVSATDDTGPVVATCTPPSGSLFAIGTTLVTCTATDRAGNVGTNSFLLTVLGAGGQAANLANTVRSFSLGGAIDRSLAAKLEAAAAAFDRGNTHAACAQLNAFSNELSAQSGKKLSAAQIGLILVAVAQIRAVGGC